MHEIFHIKDDRSVARGHTSRYGNVLWSVPLRFLWYGLVSRINEENCRQRRLLETKHLVCDGSGSQIKSFSPFPWLQEQVTTGASSN